MTLVGLVIHKAVSAVENCSIVDEVKVTGPGREAELGGSCNSLDGIQSLPLLAAEHGQVSFPGMSCGPN